VNNQLRTIRIALEPLDVQLCRLPGARAEWVALGIPGTPILTYQNSRWKASTRQLQRLVNQALEKRHARNRRKRSA
jgi:hypothetical protein